LFNQKVFILLQRNFNHIKSLKNKTMETVAEKILHHIRVVKQTAVQEEPIQWSAKMQESFAQAKRGEVYSRSLEDILNV
jgi:hypothetical protein